MRKKFILCCIFVVLLITLPLYGVYHKIAEKDLYYFTSSIAMKDNTIFIGTNDGPTGNHPLLVIDVQNPFSPQIIGNYGGFQNIKEICVYDTIIYLAHDLGGLTIGNIADPNNIAMTNLFDGLTFNSIKAQDDYAFAGTDLGFIVMNISSPQNPSLVDTIYTPEIEDVFLDQNTAYAITDSGLFIIDISIPDESIIIGVFSNDFLYPISIAYHNNHVYIADCSHIYIVDVLDPQNPILVGDRFHPGRPQSFYEEDTILYASDHLYGFGMYDISNPTEIVLVNNYVSPRKVVDCCMNDNYVFIADWAYGLEIIERDDSPNPYLIQNYSCDSLIINGYLDRSQYIYFSDYYRGLGLYDRSDPTATPIFPVDSIYGEDLASYGSYVYMTYHWWDGGSIDGILIYNCENPLQPELVYDCPYDVSNMKIHDSYMYSDNVDRVRIFSLNDPESPYYLGYIRRLDSINDYDVSDSLICICNNDSHAPYHEGLYLYNTFDSGYPQEISFLELDHEIFELEVFDTIALAAYYNESWYGSNTGFYVIDISDPTSPEILDHIIVHQDDSRIFISGFGSIRFAKNNNTLVVADNSNNRLITYDCTDFSNIQIKDEFWWNYKTTGISFNNNELITCNFGNGITVLDWTDNLGLDEPQISDLGFGIRVFPNPIISSTNISFSIKETGNIKITLYNIKGQKITSITDDIYMPGEYTIEWNGNSVFINSYSSGVYLMGFEKDGVVIDVQKVILLE
ncbi:MAG: T9SS type A sorting domain-containing protein [Candidatus Cloacimonetes bacterium]|nr:T9SS type A sorting domain-containing protein [Candidatus Cloacimonadota bacterium]